MRLPQTGGCLCSAFRYEVTRAPSLTCTCHCRDCQRLTGSAFSTAIVVAAEAFGLVGTEPRPLRRTADSGSTPVRWVCPACGVRVCSGPKPCSAPPGSVVMIRAGTLDDTSWVRPTTHFWTRSAQPRVRLPDGDARFGTQPAGLPWPRPEARTRSGTGQGGA